MEKKELGKMIILINILLLLISCNNKVEISDIDFPVKKDILLKNIKYRIDNSIYVAGVLTYEVNQFNDYKFFNENFDAEIEPNSATYCGKNYLRFIGNQEVINGFQIHIWTKEESEKILNTLLKNLGKPCFEKDGGFEKYFIWEKSNKIYILNQGYDVIIQDKKTIESDLLCLNANNLINVAISATSNTKYSDYLEYRLNYKRNITTYPYTEYIKEKK